MLLITLASIVLIISFPSISLGRGIGSQLSSADMEKNCGKSIVLNGDKLPGTYFSFTSKTYEQNVDCTLTIKAPTVNQRIIVVIDKMDIACGGDKLLIYDGKIDPASILNKENAQQCGTSKYHLRTVASNTVILHFTSNSDGKVGSGFVLNAAINFPVSTCSRSDHLYQCMNKYCISYSFNCDDRNWCGDNTQKFVCR